MTSADIAALVGYIDGLFPSSDWTDQTRELFMDKCARLVVSAQQAKLAVGQYRLTKRLKSPPVGDLLKALEDLHYQQRQGPDGEHPRLREARRIKFAQPVAFAEFFRFDVGKPGGPTVPQILALAKELGDRVGRGDEAAQCVGEWLDHWAGAEAWKAGAA